MDWSTTGSHLLIHHWPFAGLYHHQRREQHCLLRQPPERCRCSQGIQQRDAYNNGPTDQRTPKHYPTYQASNESHQEHQRRQPEEAKPPENNLLNWRTKAVSQVQYDI